VLQVEKLNQIQEANHQSLQSLQHISENVTSLATNAMKVVIAQDNLEQLLLDKDYQTVLIVQTRR